MPSTLIKNRIVTSNGGAHKCTYSGCTRSFPTEQGLSCHIGRVHTKTIKTVGQDGVRAKKSHHKMQRPALSIHFCPCCGTDLATLELAFEVASRMKVKQSKK